MSIDYYRLGEETLSRLQSLIAQRDELDVEIAKLQKLLRATVDFLDQDEQDVFASVLAEMSSESVGLTEAIRNVLKEASGKWLDPVEVRDRLLTYRFDFSRYTSNPLASVHAVLKRLSRDEVASRHSRGTTTYRWKRDLRRARAKDPVTYHDTDATIVTNRPLLPAHGGE